MLRAHLVAEFNFRRPPNSKSFSSSACAKSGSLVKASTRPSECRQTAGEHSCTCYSREDKYIYDVKMREYWCICMCMVIEELISCATDAHHYISGSRMPTMLPAPAFE